MLFDEHTQTAGRQLTSKRLFVLYRQRRPEASAAPPPPLALHAPTAVDSVDLLYLRRWGGVWRLSCQPIENAASCRLTSAARGALSTWPKPRDAWPRNRQSSVYYFGLDAIKGGYLPSEERALIIILLSSSEVVNSTRDAGDASVVIIIIIRPAWNSNLMRQTCEVWSLGEGNVRKRPQVESQEIHQPPSPKERDTLTLIYTQLPTHLRIFPETSFSWIGWSGNECGMKEVPVIGIKQVAVIASVGRRRNNKDRCLFVNRMYCTVGAEATPDLTPN